jgi:hypothetical protein
MFSSGSVAFVGSELDATASGPSDKVVRIRDYDQEGCHWFSPRPKKRVMRNE